jgi:transcriptional regulator with XRE-family HTH domain
MGNQAPGALVAGARARRGLSQRALALRAGTSQAAISRIEHGIELAGFERLAGILRVMGESLVLSSVPESAPREPDELSYEERLREAASWNLAATRLELAGAAARRAGHPATRRS